MSDQHDDPRGDDLLRQALRAEADGVTAGDDLLDRIHRAPARRHDRRPLLLVAAAAVAVAALAGGLALAGDDDGDQSLDVVDVPDATDQTSGTTACLEDPVGNPPCGDAEVEDSPVRPNLIALVREDGWLVTVDLATGVETELAFRGDPRESPSEGAASSIDSVDLSPDGRWIYYSVCCEPASGVTYRVRVGEPERGEPEVLTYGYDPAVSPDGRYLATANGLEIVITDLQDLSRTWTSPQVDTARDLVWSPDGGSIAFVTFQGDVDDSIGLLDWDGGSLAVNDTSYGNAGWFPGWDEAGHPFVIEDLERPEFRAFSQDVSRWWNLIVTDDGEVLHFRSHIAEAPLPGIPEALDADW